MCANIDVIFCCCLCLKATNNINSSRGCFARLQSFKIILIQRNVLLEKQSLNLSIKKMTFWLNTQMYPQKTCVLCAHVWLEWFPTTRAKNNCSQLHSYSSVHHTFTHRMVSMVNFKWRIVYFSSWIACRAQRIVRWRERSNTEKLYAS